MMSGKRPWVVFGILAAAMIGMAAGFIVTLKSKTEEERENELRSAAHQVESSVVNSFVKPITVAKAMSEDVNLKKYLKTAEKDPEGAETDISAYLSSLRDGFGYTMMFAVCNDSGAYYTCDGISSYIDKSYKGNSEWYGAFLDMGKEWDLDVDIEESTDWALSVFVNQLIKDEDNSVLGVCGTAVEMTQLQSLIEDYERICQVKIDVTDETGLIQIDTDEETIEKESVSLPDLDLISDGEYYYEKQASGDRVITYMKDLDLYLVVVNTQNEADNILPYLRTPVIFFLAGLLAAAAAAGWKRKESCCSLRSR